MTDLTFTVSRELEVTQIEANTDDGFTFVDGWIQDEMIVIDAGRILVPSKTTLKIRAAAEFDGLTIDYGLVASEA